MRTLRFIVMAGLVLGCGAFAWAQPELERALAEKDPGILKAIEKAVATLSLVELSSELQGPGLAPVEGELEADPPEDQALRIVGVYPLPGRRFTDEIVFYFSEDLAPGAGVQGTCFALDPNVPGAIEITGNYLRFSSPLLAGLARNPQVPRVKILLHPQIRSVSGKRLRAADRERYFVNAALGLDEILYAGTTPETTGLAVCFTQPVDKAQLPGLMTITDASGATVSWTVKDAAADSPEKMTVVFPATTAFPVQVSVAEGLRWGDPLETAGPAMEAGFPESGPLRLTQARYVITDAPYLLLEFSDNVIGEELAGVLEVTRTDTAQPVAAPLDRTRYKTVRLKVTPAEGETSPEEIVFRIPAFLASQDRRTLLLEEVRDTLTLIHPDERPEPAESTPRGNLEVEYNYWQTENIDNYGLRIRFSGQVAAEELMKHLRVAPPIDNLSVEAGGRDDQLIVKGDWQSEKDYVMHLTAGLRSSDGAQSLERDISVTLDQTPFESGAQFESPGLYYFLRKEGAPPHVKARNITEAKVKVARIFPSNLPVFVRDYLNYGEDESLLDSYAAELGTLEMTFPETRDKTFRTPVDLTKIVPADKRGVFIMTVSPEYGWNNGQRLLVYTDMGALAHWTDTELVVFVHDLFTLAPMDLAQVTVYSMKFQPMGTSATGPDGIARLGNFDKTLGEPALLVIEKGEDYTFLDLREKLDNRTPFTPDMPYFDHDGYDAFIYLDRNLYRPGEPVHMRWITRTHYVDALPGVPLQLCIANPQGRRIHEMPVTLSDFGTGNYDFQSERVHPTGKYTVELRVPGANTPIGTASFNLEEFVPNRLRATAEFDVARLAPGDEAVLSVTAENLFGGFAAGRKTEGRVFLKPLQYESKDWPGYLFGNEDELEQSLFPLGESVTDAMGKSTFTYVFEPPDEATMPLQVVASGRVLELGGRAVTDAAEAIAIPDAVMLGVAAAPRPETETLDVHVVALNPDETPSALATAKVTLERREWNYYLRRFDNRRDPRWEQVFKPVKTYDVALVEGKGTLNLPYPDYGEYRLRVHADETQMYSTIQFDRWWGKLNIAAASRPELIRLAMNQEVYHAGDRLDLRIESPYDGMAYIVAQGDAFKETQAVPVTNGEGQAVFTVPHTWFPNTWIQVSVVRNTQNREVSNYPYSSFSMINVPLDDPERRLNTTFLNLPESIRPAGPLEIALETRDQAGNPVAAEITVAAVDEGIHTILGYENPDPYTYFQRSRKFDVQQAHYYDKVFFDAGASAVGGDMMRRLGLTSQVDENWIKPVALWSGVVRSDETGKATLTFNVPEFIGQLRLVAVAVTPRAVGVAAAPVIVRRPYILRTSMPRFALSGDTFECTAVAMNLSEAPVKAAVRWTASGALSGGGEQQLDLAPGAENAFRAPIAAAAAAGQGMIDWTMTVTDAAGAVLETITEKAPLPVRSPAAYQTDSSFLAINPGESRVLENTLFRVDPGLNTRIEVSTDLFLRTRPALKYLLQYPHGCVEQTVSRAMPLYFLRNYARLYEDMFIGDMEAARVATNAERYINHAVERLFSMQTVDGGIGYWPGYSSSYPYGSVYALHFLTVVRRGHAAPVYDTGFKNLQRAVAEIMKNDRIPTASDYYLRAYACYVLALDGNLEALEFASRFDTIPVPKSARYLLAAAKAMHSSAPDSLLGYLDSAPVVDEGPDQYSGNLHSTVRADAVKLIALMQMNAPPDRQTPLVNALVEYLATPRLYTTQQTAFAVTALGMYLEKLVADPGNASARITDLDGQRDIGPGDIFTKTVAGVAPRFEIANTGTTPVYIYLEMGGNPLTPRLTPVEKDIVISREFKNEDGTPVEGSAFKHGTQYMVELTLIPRKDVENLIVNDMLPAGFEVANPRLEQDKQPETQTRQDQEEDAYGDEEEDEEDTFAEEVPPPDGIITTPSFLDVRDDRLAIAINKLENKAYTFRYLVRAVTPGRFQLPALHAECMYNPEITATTVPSEITVE